MYHPTRESVAYDYARFDRRQRVKAAVADEELRTPKKTRPAAKHQFPAFEMLAFFGALAICAAIIFSYMQVTTLTDQKTALQKRITELKGEQTALKARQERLLSLSNIEEKAKNDLQMSKFDRSQIEYVSLNNDDEIVVSPKPNDKPLVVAGFIKSFNVVVEYLS